MLLGLKCLDKPDRKKLFASDCYLNWKIFLYRIPNLFETLSPPPFKWCPTFSTHTLQNAYTLAQMILYTRFIQFHLEVPQLDCSNCPHRIIGRHYFIYLFFALLNFSTESNMRFLITTHFMRCVSPAYRNDARVDVPQVLYMGTQRAWYKGWLLR